jgi:hypothetical protein
MRELARARLRKQARPRRAGEVSMGEASVAPFPPKPPAAP